MFENTKTMVMLPVRDVERARRFYTDKLGLKAKGKTAEGGTVVEANGSAIALTPWPDAKPSSHTVLAFEVRDVQSSVSDLEGRGITFDDYDMPEYKRTGHVHVRGKEKAAWFKDPEGNVLCVHQDG